MRQAGEVAKYVLVVHATAGAGRGRRQATHMGSASCSWPMTGMQHWCPPTWQASIAGMASTEKPGVCLPSTTCPTKAWSPPRISATWDFLGTGADPGMKGCKLAPLLLCGADAHVTDTASIIPQHFCAESLSGWQSHTAEASGRCPAQPMYSFVIEYSKQAIVSAASMRCRGSFPAGQPSMAWPSIS